MTQATVTAVDFVSDQNKEKLDKVLLEITNQNQPPDSITRSGTNRLPITSEEWGEVDFESDIIESAKIEVIYINSFPLTYFVLLSADVTSSFLQKVWNIDGELHFGAARAEIRECWTSVFRDKVPGLSTEFNTDSISLEEDLPITIPTVNVGFDLHKAVTGENRFHLHPSVIQSYSSEFNWEGIFTDLGINVGGYRSLINPCEDAVTVISQSGSEITGSRSAHNSYTFIEITDENVGTFVPPETSLTLSRGHFLRLLQLLYLFYWFSAKEAEFSSHNETVRRLSLSEIDMNESTDQLQENMESLLDSESDFIDLYSKIEFHSSVGNEFLRSLNEWFSMDSNVEIGIPNKRVLSRKTNKPVQKGPFQILLEDTNQVMNEVSENYNELNNRYQSVSGQLDKLRSVQVSSTNLEINNRILWLTAALIFLPIFESFGGFEWIKINILYPIWTSLI